MKINMSTLLGMIIGIGSLLLCGVMELNHLNPEGINPFLKPSALLMIFGGTFGATLMSISGATMRRMPELLRIAFVARDYNIKEFIPTLVSFSEKARREGILALQDNVVELDDEYARKGLQLVIDGTTPEVVGEIMDAEIDTSRMRHHEGQEIFMLMGGYSPTMGIVGTVLGLIAALTEAAHGATTDVVVGAIATAFIATFYGIGAANLLWLPLQGKLKASSDEELFYREAVKQGVLAIQQGDNPRIVEEKLLVFLRHKDRHAASSQRDQAAKG